MNWGRVFAYTQIALAIAAAVGYLGVKDYRRAFYWVFAAGITAAVTWE